MTEPPRILIFRYARFGDALVAIPALRALREAMPHAHLALLSEKVGERQPAREVLEPLGLLDAFHGFTPPSRPLQSRLAHARLVRRLRRERWDIGIVLMSPNPPASDALFDRMETLLRKAGAKRVVRPARARGFARDAEGRLAGGWHEADQALRVVSELTCEPPPPGEADFSLDPAAFAGDPPAEAISWHPQPPTGDRAWFALAPFTNMQAKRWPEDRFVAVAEALIERGGVPVIIGSRAEAPLAYALLDALPMGGVLCGAELGTLAAALRRCRLYLGNDTGPMHLAAAVGTTCVAVFSARDQPEVWYPYGGQRHGHRVLREAVSCEGCLLQRCEIENKRCLTVIDPQRVIAAAIEVWNRES